jgi:hypothetical protein
MHWYARTPARRVTQVAGDVALLVWLMTCVWMAIAVDDRFEALADEIRKAEGATSALSSGLARAGGTLDDVPLVGGGISEPFDEAAGASGELGRAVLDNADSTERVGSWLALAVFLLGSVPVAGQYLPQRVRFARLAAQTEQLAGSPANADLLALRALVTRPAHQVAAAVPAAADGWRRGDPSVIDALVSLELREAGLGSRAGT